MRWPYVEGNYLFGDKDTPICINCLGSKITDIPKKYYAILGSCMTENLGIEKIVQNIVTNTAIRYVILCGEDVQGHNPGSSFLALHKNGIDSDNRIIDADGAIPYVENLNETIVLEFQKQVTIIDMRDCTDTQKIIHAAEDILKKNPKRYIPSVDLESLFLEKTKTDDVKYISAEDIHSSLSVINYSISLLSRGSHKISFVTFIILYTLITTSIGLLVVFL